MTKKAKFRRRVMAAIEAVCVVGMFVALANIAGLLCLLLGAG